MHARQLLEGTQRVFAVVLEEGDEVAGSLEAFARDSGVDASSFTAIGGISGGTLGFFDLEAHDFREIHVREQAEVVSYVGDITTAPDVAERTVHGHMVVALSDGRTLGGHLLSADVRPTFEIIVTESPAHLRRRHDPRTGLDLIAADDHRA
jgi:predicted DNA-binding protein with PD1-like motif